MFQLLIHMFKPFKHMYWTLDMAALILERSDLVFLL